MLSWICKTSLVLEKRNC